MSYEGHNMSIRWMHMTSLHYNATVKHHCVAQPCRGEGVGQEKKDREGGGGKGWGQGCGKVELE